MKPIYLTGFMGAGKTTIGKLVASSLHLPVIDTDEAIVEKIGKPISAIFADEGEAVFRNYEREILKEVPEENAIITTGGGIVIQAENRKWMLDSGTVIYLHCEPDEILTRLKNDTTRPLIQKKDREDEIRKLFESRLSFYKECDFLVDSTGKTEEDVVKEIINMINR